MQPVVRPALSTTAISMLSAWLVDHALVVRFSRWFLSVAILMLGTLPLIHCACHFPTLLFLGEPIKLLPERTEPATLGRCELALAQAVDCLLNVDHPVLRSGSPPWPFRGAPP